MVYFDWFVLTKLALAILLLYIAVRPWLKQYEEFGRVDFSRPNKRGWFLITLVVVLAFFNPIKIDNKTKNDIVIQSYNKPVEQYQIKKQKVEMYDPASNDEEIERILNEN